MADKKNEKSKDIQFSQDELTADDNRTREKALEKRNSPAPEPIRDQLATTSWPMPEDRKPAVMPADTEASLDYKMDTYSDIDDKDRDTELEHGTGTVARQRIREETEAGKDMNKVMAPPTVGAQQAAEGNGAQTDDAIVANQDSGNNKSSSNKK